VWLTRRTLRELDRRNQLSSACTSAPKFVHQFLGRKTFQRLARHGGPQLESGDVNRTMSSRHSKASSSHSQSRKSKSTNQTGNSTSATNKTRKRSSAYDASFEQNLIEYSIFPKEYEYPDGRETPEPRNLDWIRQRWAQLKRSLSLTGFSNTKFREFVRVNDRVIVEPRVTERCFPRHMATLRF
jgi:hypothetical protein